MACVALLHPTDSPRPDLGRRRTPNQATPCHGRRRRSPTKSPGFTSPPPKKPLVMGQVKLLRRGEDLEQATASKKPISADKPAESTTRPAVALIRRRAAEISKPELPVRDPVPKTSPPRKTFSGPEPASAVKPVQKTSPSRQTVSGPKPASSVEPVQCTVRPFHSASAAAPSAAAKLPESFAGSYFSLSPPPSSLPVPAFCKKT